jgi:hypothetical protein
MVTSINSNFPLHEFLRSLRQAFFAAHGWPLTRRITTRMSVRVAPEGAFSHLQLIEVPLC